jgi:hypothetical protein
MPMKCMVQVGMALFSEETAAPAANRQIKDRQERVRRTLLEFPNCGVFDDLSFALQDDAVKITGEIRKSLLKPEAEATLLKTAAVARVIHKVENLPLPTI